MVSTETVRDRGNPAFGTTLSRKGYFRRTDDDSNIEMREEVRSKRTPTGSWQTPDDIEKEKTEQWHQNNAKVREKIANQSEQHGNPWGSFYENGKSRKEQRQIFKIHFQNKRGINSKASEADMELWIEGNITLESSVSMITEYNLTKLGTINHKRIAMDLVPCSRLLQSHPIQEDRQSKKKFLKGGQAMWLQPHIANMMTRTMPDEYGRWLECDIATEHTVLSIITAYRVCGGSTDPTSSSIEARERRAMQKADHPNADKPRKAFLVDIIKRIKALRANGNKVILCMDANTHWNHKDITTLKEDTGLRDLMQTANPGDLPLPATYDRGIHKRATLT